MLSKFQNRNIEVKNILLKYTNWPRVIIKIIVDDYLIEFEQIDYLIQFNNENIFKARNQEIELINLTTKWTTLRKELLPDLCIYYRNNLKFFPAGSPKNDFEFDQSLYRLTKLIEYQSTNILQTKETEPEQIEQTFQKLTENKKQIKQINEKKNKYLKIIEYIKEIQELNGDNKNNTIYSTNNTFHRSRYSKEWHRTPINAL